MNPEIGQRIQLYFRNGLVEEGLVKYWSDDKSVIQSLSSENILVIQNTSQDIMAVKIFAENVETISEAATAEDIYEDKSLSLPTYERDPYLRFEKMADLKRKIISAEREGAKRHLTTFKPNNTINNTAYGLPGKLYQSPPIDTSKKNR